ncbi:MAG: MarR family transcriptional regulator [Saprospiraceae bacterium]|nr:MarR family transcriptional regulator [Bacteroidia bacterium]NNE14206.1 MarR family transcriptional regulator [Saprospiraceae bacterium]NNL91655.1 MarR family transcriptional regulator [Saprospiraceae bacterium]
MKNKIPIEKRLFLSLEQTSKIVREKVSEYLRSQDLKITFIQWLCLYEIYNSNGITQKNLAKALSKEEASVSRTIKKIISYQLIFKKKSIDDKKSYQLHLSHSGLAFINEHASKIHKLYKMVFSAIHEKELHVISNILKRINKKNDTKQE